MTWSRLEGLLLHWAVSRKPPPAEKWELPPRGWKTLPDTTLDAGGFDFVDIFCVWRLPP